MSPRHPLVKRLPFFVLALCACAVLLPAFTLRRAAAGNAASASAVKPNGKIAYVYQDLYAVNPDGTGQTKLVDPDTEVRAPAWSPDASKIAFSRNVSPGQNMDIFVANSDGSNVVRLTNAGNAPTGTNSSSGVTWSPDGSKLAFGSTRGGNGDIWVMNADGSNPVNLTANSTASDFDPAWSPDGSKIAFCSQRDPSDATGNTARAFEIYTMNTDGSNVSRLTDNQVADINPSWSPLGDKLAFTRRDIDAQTGAQNSDIYTMKADGAGQTNITNHPSFDFDPSWSPDGARIAFATYRDAFQNSNSEIYFMDADGGFPTRVTNSLGFEEREPDWGTISAGATPTPTPTATPTPFPPTPVPVYSITGRVTDGAGNGMPGVHIILITERNGSRSTLTKADGTYQHFYVADTRITLSPAKDGYMFNPSNLSYVSSGVVAGDKPDTNFTAVPFSSGSTFSFGAPTYAFNEGSLTATLTVTRGGTGALTSGGIVSYRTVDDPAAVRCDVAGNTAYARCDYATGVDTLYFAAGEAEKTFTLSLINDAHVENTETFALELFNPIGATLSAQGSATVHITDNDAPGQPNPIDDSRVFVRQQYLDFLSREPESAGFQAWLGVLDRCSNVNDNPDCDRPTVSSSFFLSTEFRLKGYFVYLFYKLSFGRIPRYDEIIPDMRSVSGATSAEVFAKRDAFAEAWVARQEFRNLFDAKTNADFVNTLLDRYGLAHITTLVPATGGGSATVTFTRAGLINSLNNQTRTRAQVLRSVVESDEVAAAEFNRAFVAMQYFGYLRRDPDPDYAKWLTYLDEHPGDYRTMVKGFMNSVEYRLRFGQP
ncbi:MAG TPA: DPP IV N-terminal domain-containing protein [Pyrinomonadaceae bacterium]|nr:DPP IV N-terminal domain-containing protein [Pyrinomonadaceae bacterium]